ncbi:MAG: hypothetical protein ACUVQ1_07015 [Candidatus Kapaibacteriales bacterium]
MDKETKGSENRAFGVVTRASKGQLVERLAKNLIEIAWKQLGKDLARLSLKRETIEIPIKTEYNEKNKNPEIKK